MTERRDQRGHAGETDHDMNIRHDGEIGRVMDDVDDLQEDSKKLMSDRAKLIGWCGGVSFAVVVIVHLLWPTHT